MPVDVERVRAVARAFVDAGRVVPALSIEDGRARSWWWPLPSARDRELIGSLCDATAIDDQRAVAAALSVATDEETRARLVAGNVALVAPRRGRPSAVHAWLRALAAPDPWLPESVGADDARRLAAATHEWVRSGAVETGRWRLCLRVHEPVSLAPTSSLSIAPTSSGAASDRLGPSRRDEVVRSPHEVGESWLVELLAQDGDDPSLVVPIGDVWSGAVAVGDGLEPLLGALARATRLAPELTPMWADGMPIAVALAHDEFLTFARERIATLVEAGVTVLLPSWWTHRRRLGLRARTTTRAKQPAAITGGGVGMDQLVSFQWDAALGDTRLTAAELRALHAAAAAKQELVRVRGEWVELDPASVANIVRHAGTRGTATLAALMRSGLGLDGVDAPDGADVMGVDATGWIGDLLADATHASVAPLATPDDFDGTLRAYQERGAGWLVFLGRLGLGACLADDMGLGKTAQLIATLLADPGDGPTLVVCPVSVLGNWQREIERFAPTLRVFAHHGPQRHRGHRAKFATRARRHDVVLTTYSMVARDAQHLGEVVWSRLVLDEAQQVKNAGTAQARAVRTLRAERRVALTGTPVENRLSELWSIMHVLNPGLLGTATSFRERFAIPIEREGDDEATELLRRITSPFVLRRVKSDRSIITDLPDKIETTERCPLTKEQATLYQAIVDDLLEQANASEGMAHRGLVLAGLTRLKQVCNHPAHFLGDDSALAGRSGKLARVEELLEEIVAAGDKVLCFTQFAEWGERLRPYLSRRFGVDALWLHGGVPRKRRDAIVDTFQSGEGAAVFLVSLKAGGTGLNLTAASHVIHLDRWWNPAVEDQATDRAYRIGQRHNVQVHKLVSVGTVEERIDEMITRKRALAEKVVGAGEGWITELSTADLRDVIALRDGGDEG